MGEFCFLHTLCISHAGSLQIAILAEAHQVLWQLVPYPGYFSTNYVGMFSFHAVLFMCAILIPVRVLLVNHC